MSPVRASRPDRDTNSLLDGNTQDMGLIVLEAALALAVLIFVIWWTMFSGRRGGEWHDDAADQAGEPVQPGPPGQPDQSVERGGTRKDKG